MMAVDRFGALERELVGERAAALGRIAAGMEKAIDDLRQFDAAPGGDPAERADLVAIAAERVWFYVVQRESLGWYRHEDALRFYGVPAELIVRMGPRRA
jgi:hypothetical protein